VTVSTRSIALRADPAAARRTIPRLEFLDALRGVAVAMVLLQHVGEQVSPAVRELSANGVQLGQLGVMVFFLCSGFIIPASLERTPAGAGRRAGLAAFWRGRFFRLYPLYWVSLGGVLLLTLTGFATGAGELAGSDWLANATMVQGLAGVPNGVELYWTLACEMVFYSALSALFLLGWHRHSVALSMLASASCVGIAVLTEPLLGRPAPLAAFCLATMFTGTVFYRWHAGTIRLRTLVLCVGSALAAGSFLLVSTLAGQERPELQGAGSLVPMLSAWLGAYAVFCLGVALRGRRAPRALRLLGTISYSVYLLQALVLIAVPASPSPLLTAVVWIAVTLGLSAAAYRCVELPSMRLGRRLVRRPPGHVSLPVPVPRPAAEHAPAAPCQRAPVGV
jgi:peptidoglycan/LPS O-acetylase OafA/YrhL